MLSKSEKLVMAVIFDSCAKNGACLISINEIQIKLNNKQFTNAKIKATLRSLELDGYFDLIECLKGEDLIYCINLQHKGYSFVRDYEQQRRALFSKIFLAIVSAAITFLVGRLLFYLF